MNVRIVQMLFLLALVFPLLTESKNDYFICFYDIDAEDCQMSGSLQEQVNRNFSIREFAEYEKMSFDDEDLLIII